MNGRTAAGGGSLTAPRVSAPGAAVLIAAGLPVILAVSSAIAFAVDPSASVRLLIAAAVYGPLAALVLTYGRRDVAALTAAVAVSNGWLGAALVMRQALPGMPWIEAAVQVTAFAGRLTEVATLGLLVWLLAPGPVLLRRAGLIAGWCAVAIAASTLVLGIAPAPIVTSALVLATVSFIVGCVAVVRRWRHDAAGRAAGVWFVVGVACTVLSYGRLLAPLPPWAAGIADAVFVAAQACLPVAILYGARARPLPPRILDAMALVQTVAFALAAYVAALALVRALGVSAEVAGGAAAAAFALLVGTLTGIVRRALERVLGRRLPDARGVLRGVAQHRAGTGPVSEVRDIAASLHEMWPVASVEITRAASSPVRVGVPARSVLAVPLTAADPTSGAIVVTADHEETLNQIRPVLTRTAGLIAVVVHLAELNEEVVATRVRTLDVRREERRLLRAHLRDGIAPALEAVAQGIAAAQVLLAAGDERWRRRVHEMRLETAACTEDVRRLSRLLLPTALDQGDLDGALRELATATSTTRFAVTVDASGGDIVDSSLQVSVYLFVADVLRDARASGGVRAVTVALDVEPRTVAVRIGGEPATIGRIAHSVESRAVDAGCTSVSTAGDAITAEFAR